MKTKTTSNRIAAAFWFGFFLGILCSTLLYFASARMTMTELEAFDAYRVLKTEIYSPVR